MSKSKTTGSVKIFDTHEDKIKNNADDILRNACTSKLEDLDEAALKKLIEDYPELVNKQ